MGILRELDLLFVVIFSFIWWGISLIFEMKIIPWLIGEFLVLVLLKFLIKMEDNSEKTKMIDYWEKFNG